MRLLRIESIEEHGPVAWFSGPIKVVVRRRSPSFANSEAVALENV